MVTTATRAGLLILSLGCLWRCAGQTAGDAGSGQGTETAPGAEVREEVRQDVAADTVKSRVGRETVGSYTIVWLAGTPYEMGKQHGELLHEELAAGMAAIEKDLALTTMFLMAVDLGLDELALEQSYPEIIEECQGLADAAGDVGWTLEKCLVLNFGDVITEAIEYGVPEKTDIQPGCSQVVAAGGATADGRLYHARLLDWAKIDFILEHPVVFIRRPDGGIPHAVIGFPANLSPYQGMNAAGLAIGSNEVDPKDGSMHDLTGRSHVQLVARLLAEAHDLDEARDLVLSTNHMSVETIVVSDGNLGAGEVYEMAPAAVGIRALEDGVVFATNHFIAANADPVDKEPPSESSVTRLDRLKQLVPPGSAESMHGTFSPETLVALMRDRKSPYTGLESPSGTFDDGESLATNGALYAVAFDPEKLRFWVATGTVPVPEQPFAGFSLGELLEMPGFEGTTPELIP